LRIHSRKVRSSFFFWLYRVLIKRVQQMSLQRGINFRSLAEKMGNCSGAEVRGICTEAGESPPPSGNAQILILSSGMYALRERRQYVGQEDFVSQMLFVGGLC
jgi:26S proteasome regulatory subunit T6